MLLYDLEKELPSSSFLELCRTKLNSTFVKYKGKWKYVQVEGDEDDIQICLFSGGMQKVVETTKDIETEPQWPETGYYYYDNFTVKVHYTNTSTYKVGLPYKQVMFILEGGDKITDYRYITKFLDFIDDGAQYPSINDVVHLLVTTPNTKIPLTRELIVSAHPFTERPILTYNQAIIGTLNEDNTVSSPEVSAFYSEFLQHNASVINAN